MYTFKKVDFKTRVNNPRVEDWTEEVIAGCRIWTNHTSGEVSTECPWGDSSSLALRSKDYSDEEEPVYGCGHLVYDSKELDEMFEYLDSEKNK